MRVAITVMEDDSADALRSLQAWLVDEDELRGHVRLIQQPPRPGTLGSVPDWLEVALVPGGSITVLSAVLIAWLRQRTGKVTIRATRDGDRVSVEVSAQRVRQLNAAGVREQIAQLEQILGTPAETPPERDTAAHE